MTKASIVVPAYNVAPYLPRCVESLLRQTERSLQVIIVDDGSTDETPKLADEYASNDSRVQVIHQPNGGLSAARNMGLAAASGEFICFIDSDDWVEPTMIESMIAWCDSTDSPVAVAGAHVDFHNAEDILTRSELRALPEHLILLGPPLGVDILNENFVNLVGYAWNKIYRREWLTGLGVLFEERLVLVEDIQFNAKVLAAADRVALVPEAFVHYIQRPRVTLGTSHDETLLALRFRAINSVDSLLAAWGVDETKRCERFSQACAITLWTALRSAASSPKPRDQLRQMLAQPGVDMLVAHAKATPMADWRGRWATATLGRHWYGVALLPAYGLRALQGLKRPSSSNRRVMRGLCRLRR